LKTKVRNVKKIMKMSDKNEIKNEIKEQNSKVMKVNGEGDAKGANASQFYLKKDRKISHNMTLMPRSLAETLGTITESSIDGTFLSTKAETLQLSIPIKMDTSNSDHTIVIFDTDLRNFIEEEKKISSNCPPDLRHFMDKDKYNSKSSTDSDKQTLAWMSEIKKNCKKIYEEKQNDRTNFKVAENNEESQDKQFEIAALVKQTEINGNETFTRNTTSTEDTKEKSKNNEPKIDFIDENEVINEMNETNSIDTMEAVMPSLAFVKDISLIVELPPSQLIWWNDKSKLVFEISFRGVIDSVELSKSNLFICVEPDSFSMQYFAYKTVICINNTKFKESVVPSQTKWSLNGLTLDICMLKVEANFWDASTPFLTDNNKPMKRNWIKPNPTKVSNDNEGTVKDSEAFPNFPPEEIPKNEMIFTASWGEDYVSDDDKNYFPSEDSDSDEFI